VTHVRAGALSLVLLALVAAPAARSHPVVSGHRVLFFDAMITQTGTAGARGVRRGHLDSATRYLRDGAGKAVGRFASTCVVVAVLPKGVARLHCAGYGVTADGRLDYSGTFLSSDQIQVGTIRGGTGGLRGASGTVSVRPIRDAESLVVAEVTLPRAAALPVGVIPRPPSNAGFMRRATALCVRAASGLSALPQFPFAHFDPLHPSPAALPRVGRFLTRRHDVRPILRQLNRALTALGPPSAERPLWGRFVASRRALVSVQEAQDRAALAAAVDAFIASVHRWDAAWRRAAIEATTIGVPGCVI
jgi:hypothetical protein